ncbi:MAG: phytanoyl-CoA dioxygenase family protein [Solirubrobacteraceae bacterium]
MVRLSARDPNWVERTVSALDYSGVAVIDGVLNADLVAETQSRMYEVQRAIREDVGHERLQGAGELGVLRLMLAYDDFFFRFLELPEVLAIADATVGETATLHVQNGLVLPSFDDGATPDVFQTRFHRDFPRILNGYLMSVNTFFALHDFSELTGGTLFVPGSHQREGRPSAEHISSEAITAECAPGSMIVFDSTVWHAAGDNKSGRDRMAINQQFTRSYVKQQIDYARALGEDVVSAQEPRTQQLLGWYTRVVTTLDEFYRPSGERLYRSGQG